jgi:hypothetical protein
MIVRCTDPSRTRIGGDEVSTGDAASDEGKGGLAGLAPMTAISPLAAKAPAKGTAPPTRTPYTQGATAESPTDPYTPPSARPAGDHRSPACAGTVSRQWQFPSN